MKKCIKTIICLVLICINIGVELYPSGKLVLRKYVSELDFKKVLSSEMVTKYTSHLSTYEKGQITLFLNALCQNETKSK